MTTELSKLYTHLYTLRKEYLSAGYERKHYAYTVADTLVNGAPVDEIVLSNYQYWTGVANRLDQEIRAAEALQATLIAQRNQ